MTLVAIVDDPSKDKICGTCQKAIVELRCILCLTCEKKFHILSMICALRHEHSDELNDKTSRDFLKRYEGMTMEQKEAWHKEKGFVAFIEMRPRAEKG